jgi:lipid-A-disaccharide synthase
LGSQNNLFGANMQKSKPLTIFFSVGEPSGDLHGANLIRQLQARCPGFQAVGYGGPKMAAAGCRLHADLTALAVMWFARVLLNLHKFLELGSRADRYFRHHKPDAVVLIDYPGFNWWIARRAKVHGIPVFYYSPPQIWAWARWRVKKMRRLVDHVLCCLPFEEAWLRRRGCNATFVGHPFFDEVRSYPYDEAFMAEYRGRKGPLVVLLPGSRTQEVTHNLRWFIKAVTLIRQRVPDARFALAAFKPHQAEIARKMIDDAGQSIEIFVGKTPELMRMADCAMSVSGSVSLELLYHTTPTVILYWIDRFAYFVQCFFRKVKYITLVNLIATDALNEEEGLGFRVQGSGDGNQGSGDSDQGRGLGTSVPSSPSSLISRLLSLIPHVSSYDPMQSDAERVLFPEYLTFEDKSAQIAGHIIEWLTNPAARETRVAELEALKAQVAHGGASSRAAEYILCELRDLRSRKRL